MKHSLARNFTERKIVLMENVRSIDDLVKQLCNSGYLVRQGKYLSVKPANLENRKPVRTLRLGDGYGIEELKYRIENKDKEMTLDKVLSYTGIQREYALCLRQIQIGFYRKSEDLPFSTCNHILVVQLIHEALIYQSYAYRNSHWL